MVLPWMRSWTKDWKTRAPRRPILKARLSVELLEDRSLLSAPSALAQFKQFIDHIVVIYQENWSFDGLMAISRAPTASPMPPPLRSTNLIA
jgi:phospholipase C